MGGTYSREFLDRLTDRHTAREIAERMNLPRRGGRFFCPKCQPNPSDHRTPDLSFRDSGDYMCFRCGIKGGDAIAFVRELEGLTFPDAVKLVADLVGETVEFDLRGQTSPSQGFPSAGRGNKRSSGGRPENGSVEARPLFGGDVRQEPDPPGRPELRQQLEEFITALPGSPAESYLKARGFTIELAERYGIGYADPDQCRAVGLDAGTSPRFGRIVFSHSAPSGRRNSAGQVITHLCSLYGRAIELDGYDPGALKHRHLKGPKGFFNLGAVDAIGFPDPLVICEGSFDALAFIAAGHTRAVATYGAHATRLGWFAGARSILLAFDTDQTGAAESLNFARQLSHRGHAVYLLEGGEYGSRKDAADAWSAGEFTLPKELQQ